ncbi:hypothetical protein F4804DRAFT_321777 [Jackrogersella minutella]|nr:hypothetical protein F4804DRAFT_321777 [Jackrogersella minutella]
MSLRGLTIRKQWVIASWVALGKVLKAKSLICNSIWIIVDRMRDPGSQRWTASHHHFCADESRGMDISVRMQEES